jgi:cytochrome P450
LYFCQAQDSTTIIVSMTLLMLAMYKNVQRKVVDELREVFISADEESDFEKMNNLQYMEMVIKEILRLFPISAFTMRKTTSDFELNNFIIPKDSNLFLSIFSLQRNKEYWGEDAEQFIPERFETERMKMIHPYAYLPFSGKFHCASFTAIIKFHFLRIDFTTSIIIIIHEYAS